MLRFRESTRTNQSNLNRMRFDLKHFLVVTALAGVGLGVIGANVLEHWDAARRVG